MHTLPTFKGYTIDARLKEFRKIKTQGKHFAGMEYIPFNSTKGDRLLSRYIKGLDANSMEFITIANSVL